MALDVCSIARAWRPDLIVRESAELGGCVAAEALDLPHAAVQVTAGVTGLPYSVSIAVADQPAAAAEGLDRVRARLGLAPDPTAEARSRYLLLVPRPSSFRKPVEALPRTAHAVRPLVFDQSGDETPPAWVDELPPRPTVYATLGTSGISRDVLRAVIAGLGGQALNLIVTVGRHHDPVAFPPTAGNVRVERYIPQSLLFPRCDLVVHHGGSGTTLSALAHGLPMVIIPFGVDQPENAERCRSLGVARVLPPADARPEALRRAVLGVLGEPSYRGNAVRLQGEIQALPGPEHAVGLLERLGRERQPIIAT